MKIAIVAPSPVPFCIGGAEKLWWGLLENINAHTPHQAELIKIPSPERNFWEIISSYKSFSQLNLEHFDLVISGKYPAWMVHHPNHFCYMLHRLRGLYDTYHFTKLPEKYVSEHPQITNLRHLMRRGEKSSTFLIDFFEGLEQLQFLDLPTNIEQFPGAFIREIIHFLDNLALSPQSIQKYAAISQNLTKRQDYFPNNQIIEVIYPPSSLQTFRQGDYDYLFTISRLDGAKRIRLLIEAMQYVKARVELKIAGTGPDAEELQQLAQDDQRITFLGFVNDAEVIDLYANALAVPYLPYDEDYGLVTIEAMMSGKPVLTTTDAGGPNEFVINGETGYSVAPNPQALAERIDYLCEHRQQAQQMGLTGQKLVSSITWETTINRLLATPQHIPKFSPIAKPQIQRRQKIVVALTFPVFPPRGGGQSRVFNLYKYLADYYDIELVTFGSVDSQELRIEIAPHCYERRIPKSQIHQQQEWSLEEQVGLPITDVAMPELYPLTPAYINALQETTQSADFVIACHPYLLPAIRSVTNKPLWYEAQDVESELKQQTLAQTAVGNELLNWTKKVENQCCQQSQLIMVCSREDGQKLHHLYGVDLSKVIEVPNGVDLQAVDYLSLQKRHQKKKKLGLEKAFTVVFIGSWHPPNLEAIRYLLLIAEQLPEINFLVMGSACLAFEDQDKPSNVGLLGAVEEDLKNATLAIADIAINPMTFGSGTNLKMLEYLASGIPTISTPFGIRGLGLEDGKHCLVREIRDFAAAIKEIQNESIDMTSQRVERGRKYIEEKFAWNLIAQNFLEFVKKLP